MHAIAERKSGGVSSRDRRASLRILWLDSTDGHHVTSRCCPLPPPIAPWEIHDLLREMSSGTRPCTSCCTQCATRCCNATC